MANVSENIIEIHADSSLDNEVIVSRIRAGDIWAKEVFYRHHVHKITNIVARLLRNSADIEDVVQESFLDAFKDISKLKKPEYVKQWLIKIAVHRVHRKYRIRNLKRRLGLDRSIDDEKLIDQVGIGASQEACAEILLLDRVFDIMALPDKTCWMLRYLEEYQLSEIAMITGFSLAKVKRRLAKAQALVEQHFSEAHHG
jgi:RNA polymerase sigma-70 factor (ECF subfamily)